MNLTDNEVNEIFSELILNERIKQRKTQGKLSNLSGVTRVNIAKIETKCSGTTLNTAIKLLEALDLNLGILDKYIDLYKGGCDE